jgi:hypothetical protein
LEDELPVQEGGFPGRIGGGDGGEFPVGRIGAPGGAFPMTGFAGTGNGGGGAGKRLRYFGAFLARRGMSVFFFSSPSLFMTTRIYLSFENLDPGYLLVTHRDTTTAYIK